MEVVLSALAFATTEASANERQNQRTLGTVLRTGRSRARSRKADATGERDKPDARGNRKSFKTKGRREVIPSLRLSTRLAAPRIQERSEKCVSAKLTTRISASMPVALATASTDLSCYFVGFCLTAFRFGNRLPSVFRPFTASGTHLLILVIRALCSIVLRFVSARNGRIFYPGKSVGGNEVESCLHPPYHNAFSL